MMESLLPEILGGADMQASPVIEPTTAKVARSGAAVTDMLALPKFLGAREEDTRMRTGMGKSSVP